VKLDQIAEVFEPRELRKHVRESIASRLAVLEVSEDASLIERGESRVLVACDVALLDCDFEDDLERYRVRVVPWDSVPAPRIVYVGFVPFLDERVEASFSIGLDPEFSTMYPSAEAHVVHDFYRAVIKRRSVS